jgi:hypothetical protein
MEDSGVAKDGILAEFRGSPKRFIASARLPDHAIAGMKSTPQVFLTAKAVFPENEKASVGV